MFEVNQYDEIGAAVYIALERFEDAITDCDRALEINDKFVKAYFRKAQALREKLDNLAAIEALKKGLEIEP
jgi:protein-histidine N-methyltransferase